MDEATRSSATRLGDAVEVTRAAGHIERIFGSREFFRLWVAQVVSATGDWLGLLAIIALSTRVSEGSEGAAIALVLAARVAPGFFLATAAGVLVDRLNRKRVMMACDLGRAAVLVVLPFVDSLAGLVLASFLLELMTMLWSPAKEAVVPDLVPKEKLTTANSLNVAAAYGMFPVAAGIAALLAKLSEAFADDGWAATLRLNEEGLAFYVDALSFLVTAAIIARTAIPSRTAEERAAAGKDKLDLGGAVRELREGWQVIAIDPVVRAVNLGLATGIVGGGMLVPLGSIYVSDVVDGTDADFNLVLFTLGLGMALGVVAASLSQEHVNRYRAFPLAILVAGGALLVAASSGTLTILVPMIGILGFAAGPIYVLGFTLLHETVDDELRGRVFSGLLVLVRLCLLIALAVAPLLSEGFDALTDDLWDGDITVLGHTVAVPGVRVTLWLAGLIIVGAGLLATWSLRAGQVITGLVGNGDGGRRP